MGENWRVQRRQRAGVGFAQTSCVPGRAPFAPTQWCHQAARLPTYRPAHFSSGLFFLMRTLEERTNEVCAIACPLRRLHKVPEAGVMVWVTVRGICSQVGAVLSALTRLWSLQKSHSLFCKLKSANHLLTVTSAGMCICAFTIGFAFGFADLRRGKCCLSEIRCRAGACSRPCPYVTHLCMEFYALLFRRAFYCACGATGALPPALRAPLQGLLALDLGKGLTPPLATGVYCPTWCAWTAL